MAYATIASKIAPGEVKYNLSDGSNITVNGSIGVASDNNPGDLGIGLISYP
jgi:hypothetical protein